MVRRIDLPSSFNVGAFAVASGRAAGLSEKRLRGRDLERPFHAVRQVRAAAEGGERDILRLCRAYALRMPPTQVFSHSTAAFLWGVPLPARLETSTLLHVSALDGAPKPRSAGVAGHVVHDAGVSRRCRAELAAVDPATAWLQLANMMVPDDLVAAGDHLVLTPRYPVEGDARPYVTVDDLRARLTRFRGRGKKTAAAALELVRDGSESRRETTLRLTLLRHGLPEPELNLEIVDERGARIGFGDLVYSEFKVLVEYDGEQHRTSSAQYYRDIERHDALLGEGWLHIRETKETPRAGRLSTPARTEIALRSRGWTPDTPARATDRARIALSSPAEGDLRSVE